MPFFNFVMASPKSVKKMGRVVFGAYRMEVVTSGLCFEKLGTAQGIVLEEG